MLSILIALEVPFGTHWFNQLHLMCILVMVAQMSCTYL